MPRLIQSGSPHARVMVVGEAPGADEDRIGLPFVGASGRELDLILGQSGWNRRELFLTNVCHVRPPDNDIEAFFARPNTARAELIPKVYGRYPREPIVEGLAQLQHDIDTIQPALIIALGNTPLWALTGLTGILRWRGSTLPASNGPVDGYGIKLIAMLHPAYVLRERVYRAVAIADFRRARREAVHLAIRRPAWKFTIPRSTNDVRSWFGDHRLLDGSDQPLVSDVENSISDGTLICIGFAASPTEAMCLPLVHRTGDNPHYWSLDDEVELTMLARQVLRSNPIIFHNGLHDVQIIARQWGVMPRFTDDTLVMQHVLYPGMLGGKIDPITGTVDKKGSSLSLSFCASLYCDYYKFWKLDGRGWNAETDDEDEYFRYNCEDCVRTYECFNALKAKLTADRLWEPYRFQFSLFEPVFEQMFHGLDFDDELRLRYRKQVRRDAADLQRWINTAVGHEINCGSAPQMQSFFYRDMQIPPVLHRKTRKPTLDDKALDVILKRAPVLKPLIHRIQTMRTLGVFESNYLSARLSKIDKRLRFACNVGFVETMRFSTNRNAFDEGFNIQSIPRPPEE